MGPAAARPSPGPARSSQTSSARSFKLTMLYTPVLSACSGVETSVSGRLVETAQNRDSAHPAVIGQGRRDLLAVGEGKVASCQREGRPGEALGRRTARTDEASPFAAVAVSAIEGHLEVGDVTGAAGDFRRPGDENSS